MHRETVASTMRVAPATLKSSSGGSSNPTSIHLKAKSTYVKKEIPKEDRIVINFLDARNVRLASPSVSQISLVT